MLTITDITTKINTEGYFELANQRTAKLTTLVYDKHHMKGVILILWIKVTICKDILG